MRQELKMQFEDVLKQSECSLLYGRAYKKDAVDLVVRKMFEIIENQEKIIEHLKKF